MNTNHYFSQLLTEITDLTTAVENNGEITISGTVPISNTSLTNLGDCVDSKNDELKCSIDALGGTTIDTNIGIMTAGTLRTCIAADDPTGQSIKNSCTLVAGAVSSSKMNVNLSSITGGSVAITNSDLSTLGNSTQLTSFQYAPYNVPTMKTSNYLQFHTTAGIQNVCPSFGPGVMSSAGSNLYTDPATSKFWQTTRVCTATDDTNLSSMKTDLDNLNACIDQVNHHLEVDTNTINGVSMAVGSGINGSGVQRVSIATDDFVLSNLQYLTSGNVPWTLYSSLDLSKVANSVGYQHDIITISGSNSISTLQGMTTVAMNGIGEVNIQARYIAPYMYPVSRWDFTTCFPITGSDVASFYEFGLRSDLSLAHTRSSVKKRMAIRIMNFTASNPDLYMFHGTQTISGVVQGNIITTPIFGVHQLYRWGMYLYSANGVMLNVFGYYDFRGSFIPIQCFQDSNVGNSIPNVASFTNCLYKPYCLIYNSTGSTVSNIVVSWSGYTCSPFPSIDTLLSPYKQITFDGVGSTHTYSSSNYEELFWLQYATGLALNSSQYIPIVIKCRYYSGGVNSNVQVMYCSDNSNTLSGNTTTNGIVFQPNRALTTTNGTKALDSLYVLSSNNGEIVINNAYLYFGVNDAQSNYPCLYSCGKGTNTNTIQFSVTLWCL